LSETNNNNNTTTKHSPCGNTGTIALINLLLASRDFTCSLLTAVAKISTVGNSLFSTLTALFVSVIVANVRMIFFALPQLKASATSGRVISPKKTGSPLFLASMARCGLSSSPMYLMNFCAEPNELS